MPYCPDCGRSVRAGVRFCSNCGARLNDQTDTLRSQQRERESKPIQDVERSCAYCRGSGEVDGPLGVATLIRCPVCKGSRYNLIPVDWRRCRNCGGTGEQLYGGGITETRRPCPTCRGTGWAP